MRSQAQARLRDYTPEHETTLREIVAGLQANEKRIPSKLLYDARGSELFEKICETEEYYLTRTELGIMDAFAHEMARSAGAECLLVEYGSGASLKTRLLLGQLRRPVAYVPIDISPTALEQSAKKLSELFPDLEVLPVCADYTAPYRIPPTPREPRRRLIYFPGSTIGNLEPHAARSFLEHAAEAAGRDGGMLIGVDLHKDKATLEAAYDDARGITAEFELNVLEHLNREYGADFDRSAFGYLSRYDENMQRIEMYLVSLRDQRVRVGSVEFSLVRNERILTEYSYKYTRESFADLAGRSGLVVRQVWSDDRDLFSVQYLIRAQTGTQAA